MTTAVILMALALNSGSDADQPLIRSAQSGPWSEASTWEGGAVPGAGARVQVQGGHTVLYDQDSDRPIRSIHVAGTLEFARDRDTRLDVGLIKVQAGDDASEDGFDCDAHAPLPTPGQPRPALLVGLPDEPIPAGKTATIRLTYFEGMDRETCPGDHLLRRPDGVPRRPAGRTWTKLAREAYRNEAIILLEAGRDRRLEARRPRHPHRHHPPVRLQADAGPSASPSGPRPRSGRSRRIKPYVEGGLALVTLDRPLEHDHRAEGDYRAEVANLSRNVVIESADPDGVRGHTMYHRNSAGSIGYAEFRHLGKEGVLGKYSLHFHLAGETMRGASVVGASIWDSKNRWITDPRHELPRRPRLRRLQVRRPRLLPRRRDRDPERLRPQPRRHGAAGQAAPRSGPAVRP